MGRKSEEEGIYVYIELIHFAVHQKLKTIIKQLYSNKKILMKENVDSSGHHLCH